MRYWNEKLLLFRSYSATPQFTRAITDTARSFVARGIAAHVAVALFVLLEGSLLKSEGVDFGLSSEFAKFSQLHVIVFAAFALLVLAILIFERASVFLWRHLCSGVSMCCLKCISKARRQEVEEP